MFCFSSELSRRLGHNPLWSGLLFWACGIAFCLLSWQIHKLDYVVGSVLLGLSTFVNLFCFMLGLTRIRRACLRWCTLRAVRKLKLCPEYVYCEASFIVNAPRQEMLVCDGRSISYHSVFRMVCTSTQLVHKLELHGKRCRPLVLGFADRSDLLSACGMLRSAVSAACGTSPEYVLTDTFSGESETGNVS